MTFSDIYGAILLIGFATTLVGIGVSWVFEEDLGFPGNPPTIAFIGVALSFGWPILLPMGLLIGSGVGIGRIIKYCKEK